MCWSIFVQACNNIVKPKSEGPKSCTAKSDQEKKVGVQDTYDKIQLILKVILIYHFNIVVFLFSLHPSMSASNVISNLFDRDKLWHYGVVFYITSCRWFVLLKLVLNYNMFCTNIFNCFLEYSTIIYKGRCNSREKISEFEIIDIAVF